METGYEDTVDAGDQLQRDLPVIFRKSFIPEKYKKMGKENFADTKTRPTSGLITANNTPFHEFKLCTVYGPSHFNLLDMTNSSLRDAMEDEMTKWYESYFWEKYVTGVGEGNPIGSFEHLNFPVEDGDYYAAFVKGYGKWVRCRAEVLQGFGDKETLVHLLDHGTQAWVPNTKILPLRKEYLELPSQAYAGTLKGLKNESGVDASTAKKFREATEGQKFLVHIVESHASALEYEAMTKLKVVILGKLHISKGEIPITEFPVPVPGYKRVM